MGGSKKSDNAAVTPTAGRFEWSDLRVFLHVADAQSINAAAKTLGLAQPTVT